MTTLQTTLDFARAARDEGIARSINSANRKNPGWSNNAYELFKLYLVYCPHRFQSEDFRAWAKDYNLPEPPSNRAFGGIIRRAKNDGLIEAVGTDIVRNVRAHRCYSTVWQRV